MDELLQQIADFLKPRKPWHGNRWFENSQIRIYIRRGFHVVDRGVMEMIDLSNVTSLEQGKGIFTTTLEFMEQLSHQYEKPLWVENVLEDRFAEFFRKRGYTEVKQENWPPSFWKAF